MTDSDLLPVTAYSEPKAFQAERRGLFGRGWHPIAPLGALSQPGAYVALGYGGHPVFAMTGDDGTPRVFKNVCAHQQMPVLDNGRGVCERLRCRFHGWTYDRAGVLVSAPPPVAPDGDLSDHPLARCPSEATTALLCAAFEPDPVPFDPAPWAAADKLADMTLVGSQTAALAVNWKTVVDILVGEPGLAGASDLAWDWMPPGTGLVSTDETAVLLQIVARTFRKTELHWHVFAGSAGAPDWAGPWIDSLSAASEARATAIADSTLPAVTDPNALADLHGLIAAATADGS